MLHDERTIDVLQHQRQHAAICPTELLHDALNKRHKPAADVVEALAAVDAIIAVSIAQPRSVNPRVHRPGCIARLSLDHAAIEFAKCIGRLKRDVQDARENLGGLHGAQQRAGVDPLDQCIL
jgi:hypothetical protein